MNETQIEEKQNILALLLTPSMSECIENKLIIHKTGVFIADHYVLLCPVVEEMIHMLQYSDIIFSQR